MDSKKMYIMTYDHGGYVLWQEDVGRQLKQAIEWLEKYPDFKIGLDYEAFTFDEMAKASPEIMQMISDALKKYPGRFGLGSTTYGQPLSLFISEESNVRQLTYAIRSNLKHFGQTPPVYCISEFALNNQTPQLLKLSGFAAAIMRTHVMNYGYQRDFDSAYGNWIGRDGTAIPAVPSYVGEGVGFCNTTLDNWILTRWPHGSDYSLEDFQKKFEKYEPLLASRYDDLTLRHEELVADAVKHDNWEFILLEDLPGIYGEPKDELPTGIDPLTLNAVRKLFKEPGVQHTAETVAQALTISRTTARRYLEYCASRHLIIAEIVHGKVGRPQRIYHSG